MLRMQSWTVFYILITTVLAQLLPRSAAPAAAASSTATDDLDYLLASLRSEIVSPSAADSPPTPPAPVTAPAGPKASTTASITTTTPVSSSSLSSSVIVTSTIVVTTTVAPAATTSISSTARSSTVVDTAAYAIASATSQTSSSSATSIASDSSNAMDHHTLIIILSVVLVTLGLFLLVLAFILLRRYSRRHGFSSRFLPRGVTPINDDEIATWRGKPEKGPAHHKSNSSVVYASPESWNLPLHANAFDGNEEKPAYPPMVARAPNARSGLTDEAIPGAEPFVTTPTRQSRRLSKHGRTKSRRSSVSVSLADNFRGPSYDLDDQMERRHLRHDSGMMSGSRGGTTPSTSILEANRGVMRSMWSPETTGTSISHESRGDSEPMWSPEFLPSSRSYHGHSQIGLAN